MTSLDRPARRHGLGHGHTAVDVAPDAHVRFELVKPEGRYR